MLAFLFLDILIKAAICRKSDQERKCADMGREAEAKRAEEQKEVREGIRENGEVTLDPVSYTHLTLPTIA